MERVAECEPTGWQWHAQCCEGRGFLRATEPISSYFGNRYGDLVFLKRIRTVAAVKATFNHGKRN
jgi:hypothetical protein